MNHARSTVCGSTADGMGAGMRGGLMKSRKCGCTTKGAARFLLRGTPG
jgi:hypothetical protein